MSDSLASHQIGIRHIQITKGCSEKQHILRFDFLWAYVSIFLKIWCLKERIDVKMKPQIVQHHIRSEYGISDNFKLPKGVPKNNICDFQSRLFSGRQYSFLSKMSAPYRLQRCCSSSISYKGCNISPYSFQKTLPSRSIYCIVLSRLI